MYTMAASIEVNPKGSIPLLSRTDVWRGLVMKAENALPFVPAMQICNVLERFDGGLLREVVTRGESFRERVTFTPEMQVLFDRTDSAGKPSGWISNVLSDSNRGLMLTFAINVVIDGVTPGSPEERERGEAMKLSYVDAINATLHTTRTFVLNGKINTLASPVTSE